MAESLLEQSGPEVIQLFSCSTQLKLVMLINVKMPTIIGIVSFISMLNTTSESLKARKTIFQPYSFRRKIKSEVHLNV